MAAARYSYDNVGCIEKLQQVFGNISAEDCRVLLEEFGGSDIEEIIQNVYEAVETSRFTSVGELVWHLKQDPSYGVRRSSSLHERNSRKDSWSLARSKSSNTVPKNHVSRQSSSHKLPSASAVGIGQPMPFSGTRKPVKIVRRNRTIEPSSIGPYLTKYMQDTETRNLFYDVFENRYPKLLILMRGASGSGKSTLAAILWAITENGEICSADYYFLTRNGEYKFNRSSLGKAHETCQTHCKAALARGLSPIVIDNTNTKVEEMMPYVQMAVEHNYKIKIVEPKTDWKRKAGILAQKSLHNVPKRTIEDQLDRFENTTVQSMVDRVMRRQGMNKNNYNPGQELEWEFAQPVPVDTWTPPSRVNPNPAALSPMMGSLSVSSTPAKPRVTASSPLPTQSQSTQFSWSEPPAAPPSPILLSDLVPDFKRGNSGTGVKHKRSAKRNGNASVASAGNSQLSVAARPILFEDPAHLEFEKLRKLFPAVAKDELERIFNVYEGDVDVCASVLMDEGVEMTGSLDALHVFQSSQTDVAEPTNVNENSLWESNRDFAVPGDSNSEKNGKLSSSTDDDEEGEGSTSFETCETGATGEEIDSDVFEMIVPKDFARVLLCAYGHSDDENRHLSPDELTVKVPADTAFEIYKLLYLNMHKAEHENERSNSSDSVGSTRSNSPANGDNEIEDEFNAIAICLSQMELETSSGDPQLAAIIDIETKLSQQTQETYKSYSAQNRTMAQNVSFSMLKQEYPYLDAAVIDEVYTQCFLSVEKTKSWLNEMYPQSATHLKASKAASVSTTWHVMYNPKDVQLYSQEDIRQVQRTYENLEQEWLSQMDKMKDCYNRCKTLSNAQIRGHYISEAKKISDRMKSLSDEMQYYKALSINAKHKNDQILDLHGLKINGAMRVLKEFLQFKEDEFVNAGIPKMILLIITGQGKHSRNGCPVLQPAVRNFLTQRKYRFHCGKPGSYTVILTRGVIARRS